MADEPDLGDGSAVPPVPAPDEGVAPPAPVDVGGAPEAGEDDLGPGAGPGAAPERCPEADEREEDDRGHDDLRRVHQLVNNNFYGVVDASGAAFGFDSVSSPGLAPGTIEPQEADRALRFYIPPRLCFDEALGKLREDAFVVLTGQDNCGRGAGSLALLREILGEEAGLRSLSPANSLAELAASRDLKPGQGYVILDYVGELNIEAVQAYSIGRLSEELRRRGSYLVITAGGTTHRRLALRDHCVAWRAPDPVELFERCRSCCRTPPYRRTPSTSCGSGSANSAALRTLSPQPWSCPGGRGKGAGHPAGPVPGAGPGAVPQAAVGGRPDPARGPGLSGGHPGADVREGVRRTRRPRAQLGAQR